MLFWIEWPREEQFDWSGHLDAWDNLGEAGYKGDHFVLGDPRVLDEILSISELSRRSRAYFRSVKSRFATLAGIRRKVRPVIVAPSNWAAERGSDGSWVIPASALVGTHACGRAVLLCEHVYDCRVIASLGDVLIRELGLASVSSLGFHFATGGGGGMHLTLAMYLQDPSSLGICVVDSDRDHPRHRLGATASTCSAVADREAVGDHWKWMLHVLEARELENVIPPSIWAAADQPLGFTLAGYYHQEVWGVAGYVDTKKGDLLCRFLSLGPSDQSYRDVRASVQLGARHGLHGRCFSSTRCLGSHPPCQLSVACGERLRRLADWCDTHGLPRTFAERVPAFMALVEEVLRVGIAARLPTT